MYIHCDPGYDGGIQQMFTILVFTSNTSYLITNKSSEHPKFIIKDVKTSEGIKIVVYASNKMGRSQFVVLYAEQIKLAEKVSGN